MKKAISLLLLSLGIVFLLSGQTSEPIDLILVLDTSSSMSSSYREMNDYISGPFLREFLRIGDTFHLISFSGSSRSEISRRIEGVGDIETLIGRLFLMLPVDPYTDIAGALDYTERYVTRLPSSRPKKVVFVTDGDQNPRPGTSGAVLDSAALENRVNETAARLRRDRTDFNLVKFPLVGNGPSSGRPSVRIAGTRPPAAAPQQQQVPRPAQVQPPTVAPRSPEPQPGSPIRQPPAPQQQQAPQPAATPRQPPVVPQQQQTPQPAPVQQPSVAAPQQQQAPQPAATPGRPEPQQPPAAPQQQQAPQPAATPRQSEPQPGSPVRQPPAAAPQQQQTPQPARSIPVRPFIAGGFNYLPWLVGLGIAVILVVALIIFFMTRRLNASPNRAMAYVAGRNVSSSPGKPARNADLLTNYAAGQRKGRSPPLNKEIEKDNDKLVFQGPILLSLVVDDQNTSIGMRNTHSLKPGNVYTLGGGNSDDYFIFLVPLPAHLGEIRSDGMQCTFVPRKPQYFPETGAQPVSNCIGKTIHIISDKRYELTFHFERYEDPLDSLNRLLNSVSLPPGLPRKDKKS